MTLITDDKNITDFCYKGVSMMKNEFRVLIAINKSSIAKVHEGTGIAKQLYMVCIMRKLKILVYP